MQGDFKLTVESKFKTGLELQRSVLTLSIGDIIAEAKNRGIELSDDQAEDLFYQFDTSDPLMESFFTIIECQLDEIKGAVQE